ncbi:MAG TPA: TonB family protein [Pyrinomonadaceae bacterium]|nr:TonB family protein [Pyrinomonadaceae bacterium]
MIALRPLATLIALLTVVMSSLCLSTGRASTQTQQPTTVEERDRAIDLYKQGDRAGAIKILKDFTRTHPTDADAWYFFGLAYYNEGWFGAARDAFEHLLTLRPDSADANAKLAYALILAGRSERATAVARHAIELGDQSAEAHYAIAEASLNLDDPAKAIEEADLALHSKSDFAPALITKSLAYSSLKQPAEAAASLEKFLAISPNDPDSDVWREQMERLRKSAAAATSSTGSIPTNPDGPFNGKDVTVRARVLSKPEPTYSDIARKAGVTGTVVMRCVFASDGTVRSFVIVRALSYGLTAKAVEAARGIKFTPANKDGKPVSMWMQLQYNFNLY